MRPSTRDFAPAERREYVKNIPVLPDYLTVQLLMRPLALGRAARQGGRAAAWAPAGTAATTARALRTAVGKYIKLSLNVLLDKLTVQSTVRPLLDTIY